MLQILASLTDNSRGVIDNRNMFIVQTTGQLAFVSKAGANQSEAPNANSTLMDPS